MEEGQKLLLPSAFACSHHFVWQTAKGIAQSNQLGYFGFP
jgi:hypothetical protein